MAVRAGIVPDARRDGIEKQGLVLAQLGTPVGSLAEELHSSGGVIVLQRRTSEERRAHCRVELAAFSK